MKPGDIILVHSGKSILARGITYYMKKELEKKGINPENLPFIPHHAGTVVDVWGKLHIAEAVGRGYIVQPLLKAYSIKDWENRVKLFVPVTPYTKQQQEEASKIAVQYSLSGIPYDYSNFIFHIIQIKTGLWIGPKDEKAEARFYCSEVAANIANDIQPGTFPKSYKTSPVGILMSDFFRHDPKFSIHDIIHD